MGSDNGQAMLTVPPPRLKALLFYLQMPLFSNQKRMYIILNMATLESSPSGERIILNELSLALTRLHETRNSSQSLSPVDRNKAIKEVDKKVRHYFQLCQRMNIPKIELERTVLEATPKEERRRHFTILSYSLTPDECKILAKEFQIELNTSHTL